MSIYFEHDLANNPDFGVGRGLVLDPQAAGALLCRRLCGCPRGLIEGATAAVDIAVNVRNGGVSASMVRLLHAASCQSAPPEERQQHFEALAAHHQQLEVWAERLARKTSRTALRWLVRRLPGLMAARSMP